MASERGWWSGWLIGIMVVGEWGGIGGREGGVVATSMTAIRAFKEGEKGAGEGGGGGQDSTREGGFRCWSIAGEKVRGKGGEKGRNGGGEKERRERREGGGGGRVKRERRGEEGGGGG